ncbi:transketolase C-terminal domain-containing protein [Streptomyces sp. L7]
MAEICPAAAERATQDGIRVTVVDPRWVKPVPEGLCALAAQHGLVVTVEDNGRIGGAGSAVAQALKEAGVQVPVRHFGLDQRFFQHGTRGEVLEESGVTPDDIARDITATCGQHQ